MKDLDHVKSTPPDILLFMTEQTFINLADYLITAQLHRINIKILMVFIHSLNSLKIFTNVGLEMVNDFQINTIGSSFDHL